MKQVKLKDEPAQFKRSLFRWYGRFLSGFFIFCLLMGGAEWLGWPKELIGYSFLGLSIGLYAIIGIASRTNDLDEYYVAGRRIPAFFNGLATGADWMSAASFISLAGTLYVLGYDGLAYITGWTGGFVLLAFLLAPYLRKFGQYTIPDFMAARFDSKLVRLTGAICAIITSFTYVTAQVTGVGLIMARFLNIDYNFGIIVGIVSIMFCSFLGGMKAITWTQVAQCLILIIAYLIPVTFLAVKLTSLPLPQIMYGAGFEHIADLETKYQLTQAYAQPFTNWSGNQFIALMLCLMCGTAGLPHILIRSYTVPNVKQARQSVGWALLVIVLLYLTVPAYATLMRWEVLQNVAGRPFSEVKSLSWVQNWERVHGMLQVEDKNGDGIAEIEDIQFLNPDMIVLAAPEIARLPYVVVALVAVGGLAAALSTADGLLIVIASALSHDIYHCTINPQASPRLRLLIGKGMILISSSFAALLAVPRLTLISETVAWAFSLAASTFFPVLVLAIFWKRCNSTGAISGMISGLLTTISYIIISRFGPTLVGVAVPSADKPLNLLGDIIQIVRDTSADGAVGRLQVFGIFHTAAGVFGLLVCFSVTIGVSLLTKTPAIASQNFIADLRQPIRLQKANPLNKD